MQPLRTLFLSVACAALLAATPLAAQTRSGSMGGHTGTSSTSSGTTSTLPATRSANPSGMTGTTTNATPNGTLESTTTPSRGTVNGTIPSTVTGSNSSRTGTAASGNTHWDTENQYWRRQYPSQSYYNQSRTYSAYEPAYRYGVDLYRQNPGRSYNELDQTQLRANWDRVRGNSQLNWEEAQRAAQDSYTRLYETNRTGRATGVPPSSPSTINR